MKKTEHFSLNLMEAADILSAKPLNENTSKIDAVLKAQADTAAGKIMLATGRYTGTGGRTVTLLTPGFKPLAMLLRRVSNLSWGNEYGTCWWLGNDIPVGYTIIGASDSPHYGYEPGETYMAGIETTISFSAEHGKLTWSIPDIPQEYYGVTADGGPAAISNDRGISYEWIAFGTAK